MDTPDLSTLGAVNVTLLPGVGYPKTISEREYVLAGTIRTLTETATATITKLGKNPVTLVNPMMAGVGVLGTFGLVSIAGAGGSCVLCADGTVRNRLAAGTQTTDTPAPQGGVAALNTILGAEVDDVWTVGVVVNNSGQATITITDTTPNPDKVWIATVAETGLFTLPVTVVVGNPVAYGTKHTGVENGMNGIKMTAVAKVNDSVAPSVTAFVIPATGTSYTVTVSSFTATDAGGVTGFIVTESATAPAASAAGWSALAPATYTIATANQVGTGAYALYGWAKDGAGNVSTSSTDSITLTIT